MRRVKCHTIQGVKKNLKAYWKGNSTLVIETSKDYATYIPNDQLSKRPQVKFLDDVVQVEYIEK